MRPSEPARKGCCGKFPGSRTRRRRPVVAALLSAGLLAIGALAQGAPEYEVKAAFLLNFTKFVDWPAAAFTAPNAPLTICVLGRDPFGRVLDQIVQGEAVDGHKLEVRRITEAPPAGSCQVVFVNPSEEDLTKLLSGFRAGVLTVGEGETFVRRGGVIGFVIENRRVRFDINRSAAERAGLRLSSRLLSVAKSVEGGRP